MTTYTPAQYLEKYCPALYALGAGVYGFWLESTLNRMNANVGVLVGWGSTDARNEAQALLAAHRWAYLTGAYQDLGGGQVSLNTTGTLTTQSTGRESEGYGTIGFSPANIQRADMYLTMTRWGLQYLAIRESRPSMGAFAVVPG